MKKWQPIEIETFRKQNKLSRRAIGEMIGGVSVSTVYKWERGLRSPGKSTKILLSRIEQDFNKKGKEHA